MGWTGAGIGAGIGMLFGGPIGAGIGAGIGSYLEESSDEEDLNEEKSQLVKLTLHVQETIMDLEDGSYASCFVFKINGDIQVPSADYQVHSLVEIFDTTNNEYQNVFTNEEAYNHKDDGTFYKQDTLTIPYEITTFDNSELEHIFIENLILPRKGKRNLYFRYTISEHDTHDIIAVLEERIDYLSPIDGYEDIQENKPIIEEIMLKMMFYMSGIDGNIDLDESKVISSVGKMILEEDYPEEEREEHKKRINGYISSAYKEVKSKSMNIEKVIEEANQKCPLDVKYLIFDYCLEVAAADGIADKGELELAYYMGEKLQLDQSEYHTMIEKKLPITIHNEDDIEHTFEKGLGIVSGMTNIEITEILKKEFKKWNQRIANVDSTKREQAEQMIHKISELRKKYKN